MTCKHIFVAMRLGAPTRAWVDNVDDATWGLITVYMKLGYSVTRAETVERMMAPLEAMTHKYADNSNAARIQAIADAMPDTMQDFAEELIEIAWSVHRAQRSVDELVNEAREDEIVRYDGVVQ